MRMSDSGEAEESDADIVRRLVHSRGRRQRAKILPASSEAASSPDCGFFSREWQRMAIFGASEGLTQSSARLQALQWPPCACGILCTCAFLVIGNVVTNFV